jgi:hypothetical protein
MVPAEERGVRRSIAFSELLRHPNLVRCMGQWEEADTIYVGEWWMLRCSWQLSTAGCH